ncbi:MAG: CHASE3 domain-containing protein [Rhodospirillaceae bacterium]|nr:CHASE3 domain-containing protein [Rhodospirillaceae bacterium]
MVLASATKIIGSAVDIETGMRGYLLAGKEDFLDPYNQGEKTTYAGIEALQEVVNDNPAQVERLGEAAKILHDWQADVTEPAIALRREIGDAKTMNDMADLVGEARGKVVSTNFGVRSASSFSEKRPCWINVARNSRRPRVLLSMTSIFL